MACVYQYVSFNVACYVSAGALERHERYMLLLAPEYLQSELHQNGLVDMIQFSIGYQRYTLNFVIIYELLK